MENYQASHCLPCLTWLHITVTPPLSLTLHTPPPPTLHPRSLFLLGGDHQIASPRWGLRLSIPLQRQKIKAWENHITAYIWSLYWVSSANAQLQFWSSWNGRRERAKVGEAGWQIGLSSSECKSHQGGFKRDGGNLYRSSDLWPTPALTSLCRLGPKGKKHGTPAAFKSPMWSLLPSVYLELSCEIHSLLHQRNKFIFGYTNAEDRALCVPVKYTAQEMLWPRITKGSS